MKNVVKQLAQRFACACLGKYLDAIERSVSDLTSANAEMHRMVIDGVALTALSPFLQEYTPWTSASLRPSALQMVINDIVLNNHVTVVECGAGVSTLVISRLLQKLGGKLYSLEHDAIWRERIMTRLENEGLQHTASIIHAPLEALAEHGTGWYRTSAVLDAIPHSGIDLLLIDGPPAYKPEESQSRHPVLPLLWDRLSKDATIFLDDVGREGERIVIDRWEKEFGLSFVRSTSFGGVAYAHRSPSYAI